MRQSEARDLRSYLAEPVEEIVVEKAKDTNPFLQNPDALHEAGVRFITPWLGTEEQLPGTGVRFAIPWEGTGGQLHEVASRFTSPLTLEPPNVGARFTSPLANPLASPLTNLNSLSTREDLTLQPTQPMARIPEQAGGQSGQNPLRPNRLERYQAQGAPIAQSGTTTVRLRPAGERRITADLAPAPQKVVPGQPLPALQSWERKRRAIYTWLILLTLFLLVILGGIGLDSLIASYR